MDSGVHSVKDSSGWFKQKLMIWWVFLIDLLTLFSISEGVYWLKPEIHDSNNNSYICESLWKIVYLLLSGKTRICQADSNKKLIISWRSHLLQVCVHGVCVFTAVCVHSRWARILSMGHHTLLYVTSLSLSSHWLDPKTSLFNLANYFPIRSIQWVNWVMS